jgi:DNA helicase-2/ATP-dependent DNA helicase PcrA
MDEISAALTEAQRDAVQHLDGPLLILAGPGSGKTRVVTHRIAHMLRCGVRDHQIVALTFTNKAADEMQARLAQLVPHSRVWTGTFHRFCARLLRRYAALAGLQENFSIYDTDDTRALLREALVDIDVDLTHTTLQSLAAAVSRLKSDLAGAGSVKRAGGEAVDAIAAQVYPHYQKRLLAANAVDFDDLLLHVAVILHENAELRSSLDARYRYVLVDEFQDTNLAQYAIVRALSLDYPNLAATGDPDQSIYGWRGASTRNINQLERDYPDLRVVRLEHNFRSCKRILRAADLLIANNVRRKAKQLITENPEGVPVRLARYESSMAEAQAIATRIANEIAGGRRRARDFAIFYRINALSRSCEQALRAVSVPYQIVRGLEFYNRKEVKDVLGYLRLLNNPADDAALLRVINVPPRRIGKTTVNRLLAHCRRYDIPLLQAARESGLIDTLGKRAAVQVARFVALIDELRAVPHDSVQHILSQVLQRSGYSQWLAEGDLRDETQRVENIDELLSDAREFDETHVEDGGLEAFLEQASLVADTDAWEADADRVTLMTLHAAKGLEFPVVFIVAVEDKMLPHERSRDDPEQLEEERRLLFVGMTRAEEELQLSFVQQRRSRGDWKVVAPSQFLVELPQDELELIGMESDSITFCQDPDLQWEADWELEAWDAAARQPPRPRPGRTTRRAPRSPRPGKLRTAAQMVAGPGVEASGDGPLRLQMLVTHPEYGLGRVVELEGSGRRQMARVQFFDQEQPITLSVLHSPLQPVQ